MSAEKPLAQPTPLPIRDTTSPIGDDVLREAVEELFVACQQRISRYLVQFVRDRELAADLLQDTFHDALTARGRLADARSKEAWLFGIARNRALRAVRKRQRFDRALRRLGARRADGRDDEEVVAVQELLARTLNAQDRALVLLRYLHDFEAGELAEMTGLAPETVRQRLWRARARLRAAVRTPNNAEGEPR
jgi:RNA polymerase sigma-70 factor (ECF subfamily)